MKEIIKREIEQATSSKPITSTRLIEIVRAETGERISARKVRFIVTELREVDYLPILATRKGLQGYYICKTSAEFDAYEKEVRQHSIKELTTIKNIRQSFFGKMQGELLLI